MTAEFIFCRACKGPCITHAERAIKLCIDCVKRSQARERMKQQHRPRRQPGYGFGR